MILQTIPTGKRNISCQIFNDITNNTAGTFFGGGSSFNDGTSQTVLDPLGRGPVRTHIPQVPRHQCRNHPHCRSAGTSKACCQCLIYVGSI